MLYTTTYSLCFYHHSNCTCVSHPHFPWYHTLCIYDIAPNICLTSDILCKFSHPQFMTSSHIIYDITCPVFMSSLPRYLTLYPQNLCPHNPSKYDLWTTVCMTSHPLYIWHLIHHTYRHIQSLNSHHCSNHITSTAFMISHTLFMVSHTWQHKSSTCHLTLYIWHYIQCICVIKPNVSIVFYPLSLWHYTLYVWHHIQNAWHHMNTLWHHTHIVITSHQIYWWHHI